MTTIGGSEGLKALSARIEETQSADAAVRRQAEAFLEQNERAPGFPSMVLQLVAEESIPVHIRLGSAIYFKNWSKRSWESADPNEREAIKQSIVGVLLSSPDMVRRQLSEMLAIALEVETRETWPNLLPELGQKLAECNAMKPMPLNTIEALLGTMDAVFEPYRHKFRTDEFFLEIKHALHAVQEPLTAIFDAVAAAILTNSFDAKTVGEVFSVAKLCGSIFYSLNWQDLPAYFEDHMSRWMDPFLKLLEYQNAALEQGVDDSEPSPLDLVQAQIIENVNLYQSKYEEEFQPYLERAVSAVFTLLQRGGASRFDSVATTGIRFLTTISRSSKFQLFAAANILPMVCERIILPNMQIREEDVELFEDNPTEYMRLDVEGSDAETRRRCAVELVRGLNQHFEAQVTDVFSKYVTVLLGEYEKNPLANWKAKDTAIYLVTALGWRTGTQAAGATSTSGLVSVQDFYTAHIVPEIFGSAEKADALPTPVLTADALKYTITFRNQLPADVYSAIFEANGKLMSSNVVVVHSYAALTVERLLSIKQRVSNAQGANAMVWKVPDQVLQDVLPKLLPPLFQLIPAGGRENEYVMKCIVRVVVRSGKGFGPFVENAIRQLCSIVEAVSRNPSNPSFNHYLFESLAAIVSSAQDQLSFFESVLIPMLHSILTNEIVEFAPYALQILAKIMGLYSKQNRPLPDFFRSLAQTLLAPPLWDRSGFVPGMVKYLQGYIRLDSAYILEKNSLAPILGVFQKLISSRANDHLGMALLRSIIETYDANQIQSFLSPILNVIMTRLHSGKTSKFLELVIVILSVWVIRYGPDSLAKGLDQLETHLLARVLTQVWAKTCLTTPASGTNRRLLSVALTSILCTERFTTEPYAAVWADVLNANIALLEGIQLDADEDDDKDLEESAAEQTGFNVAYSQLANAREAWEQDLVSGVEPHAFLAKKLAEFTALHPSVFSAVINAKLEEKAQAALKRYLVATGSELQ